MPFKFLKMRLASALMALAMAGVAGFGIAGPTQAATATSSTDCLDPLSIQEQATCSKEKQVAETGFDTAMAWLFPAAEEKIMPRNQPGIAETGEGVLVESARNADSLSSTALLLFGAALVGIAYLGRRRRAQPHGRQADIDR